MGTETLDKVKHYLPLASVGAALFMWLINTEINAAIAPMRADMNKVNTGIEFLKRQGYTSDERLDELTRRLDAQEGAASPVKLNRRHAHARYL